MRDNKLHTPDGVKDYLPVEMAFKKEIENRICAVFERYGYCTVASPMFEYMEVFEGMGSTPATQMYKFIDRDGSILALRSDMTPPIARMAAANYRREVLPLRFCYFENAFRYNENYQGKLREFTQAGVELIGMSSDDANAEVIAIAINSLISAGLNDFRIDLGQVEFMRGLLEEAAFDVATSDMVQDYILQRDFVSVESTVAAHEMPPGVREIFSNLPLYIGGIDMLDNCRSLVSNSRALSALDNLMNIYGILTDYKLDKYVSFDLSMIGQLDYYTGIIFRGYTYGTGLSIIDGGRYDGLIRQFGADFPSVGFAIKMNGLMTALEKQNIEISTAKADTLVVYTNKGRALALETADELRSKGLFIENSLLGGDIGANIAYACDRGIGGILYFENGENVRIINIETGDDNVVSIEQLTGGGA